MTQVHEWREAKEGSDTWAECMVEVAYNECAELQVNSVCSVISRIAQSAKDNNRLEYRCLINGEQVAAAILTRDHDVHVGFSWATQWLYVLPAYRHLGIAAVVLRKLRELAKEDGLPYSYTQRSGVGKYTLTYGGFYGEES